MTQDVFVVEKKSCPRIEKSCSLTEAWESIGTVVASRFGGPEFLPVPYLLDANAYGIGHVFVPVTTKVKLGSGNRGIVFTASDCNCLSKPDSMVATRDVTIDRSSHEDLTDAKWIGLITEVVASNVFQMEITAKLRGRTFHVGDNGAHTFLFKYEIYKLDENGKIRDLISDTKEFRSMKWEPVDRIKRDKLPMSSLN